MATYSKVLLSGSTNGRAIKVAATASPGTTIHTAVSGTSSLDEVWIYAENTSTANVLLTIEFGGTTSPDDQIIATIAPQGGLALLVPGICVNNGVVIKAFAATANVITIVGFVNRIV